LVQKGQIWYVYPGEKHRNSNNFAEWIHYRNRIYKEEYGSLAQLFVWNEIPYNHHQALCGVVIWDTKIGDYSLSKLSGTNRGVIREFADT